jgi:hypothetical protein
MCRSGRGWFVVEMNGGRCPPMTRRSTMARYLLSVHTVDSEAREPMTDEQLRGFMQRVAELETEMRSAAALAYSGRLHGPETATVVSVADGEVLVTDGPFAEAKEHLGGFYIVDAADLDAALAWAEKTSACVGRPIEVRPFFEPAGA